MNVNNDDIFGWIRRLLFAAETQAQERANSISPQVLGRAVRRREHSHALKLIKQGADPFEYYHDETLPAPVTGFEDGITAFHWASGRGDIEILLAMAAEPGTEWEERFFFSRKKVIKAPVRGRSDIAFWHEDFFEFGKGLSMEGLEVMLMYGYELTDCDLEDICDWAGRGPKYMQMLKFCLATTGGLVDNIPLLNSCLGVAVGGENNCFVGGKQTSSLELAIVLLKAGADPNGYCMEGHPTEANSRNPESDNFTPALFQALKNGDESMAKLLIAYGADTKRPARVSRGLEDGEVLWESISLEAKAREKGMIEILKTPVSIVNAKPNAYINELCRESMAPLKERVFTQASSLVVTAMRCTGHAPPVGLMSSSVLEFCYGPQVVEGKEGALCLAIISTYTWELLNTAPKNVLNT